MKQKLRLLFTMLLLAVMGSALADISTLTFTSACGGSGTANDGVSWTVTSDGNESTFDSTKGIHYGTSKAAVSYLQLKTSGINGTITKIVVNASGASSTTAILDVTVGGVEFDTQKSLTANATNYTLEGSASGEIVVKLSQNSAKKALYVKSIEVTYSSSSTKVTTPTFFPISGEVTKGTVVSFNCATEGVTYYYTTDGTNPTINSLTGTSYTVNANVILEVIAVKEGMENSSVATASYTVAKNNPNLEFSESRITANIGESFTPPTLSFADGYDGSITYSSSNNAITVNETTGEVSFNASAVGKTTTITATASETTNFYGGTASYVLSVVDPNIIEGNLNNETFGTDYEGSITPISGFDSETGTIGNVAVTYAKGSASYAYINNSHIRLYKGSQLTFSVPDGYYIKALTFNSNISGCTSDCGEISDNTWSSEEGVTSVTIFGPNSSNVQLSTVKISLEVVSSAIAKPTITPSSGTYTSAQTVTITNNAEGATVYYTIDGSVPTALSSVYSNPFELSKNGTYTVKAIAINGDEKSSVVTSNIVINIHVDAPVFTETDGTTFSEPYTIHLTSAQGTTIYYTTGTASPIDENGNLSADAKVYNTTTGIANLTKEVTINAVAIDNGGNYSETVKATYLYTGSVTVPYYENFDSGLGMFTVESSGTNPPEWEFRENKTAADIEKYGEARQYAFVTANGGKRGTARLISPVIDLTEEDIESASLNFIHAGRYFDGYNLDNLTEEQTESGNAPTHAQLFVREEGGTWQQLTIPNWFAQSSNYTRRNSGEISLNDYVGKKVQVSFLFTSDENSTGTWNVMKFAVTVTKEEETVNYETVNMKTDGYITYVVKNDIDWDATMKMNNNVYGYKVIQFTEAANGGTTVLVELGNDEEMAVDETKLEEALTTEQKKPLWSEKIIPAGTPIILKGKAGDNLLVIAKSDDVIPSVKGNLLKPSFGDVQGSGAQTLYVLQKSPEWVATNPYENYMFYKLANGRTIPERKAYLNGTDASDKIIYYLTNNPGADQPGPGGPGGAKANFVILAHAEAEDLVSEDAGLVDGINEVNGGNRMNDNEYYSISGVKVSNPSKGIYILNGKKVIVK